VAPPARFAAAPAPAAEDTLGLPKRVRYDDQEAASDAAAGTAPSTPGEIGALVASLQHGWLGGRKHLAEQDD
jgi:hypothetical protein